MNWAIRACVAEWWRDVAEAIDAKPDDPFGDPGDDADLWLAELNAIRTGQRRRSLASLLASLAPELRAEAEAAIEQRCEKLAGLCRCEVAA